MNSDNYGIKKLLVKTPLYYYLLKLRATFQVYNVMVATRNSIQKECKTAYCISPYKTGTTYMSGLFKDTCKTAHEPLQFTTLLNINNVDFLKNRAKYLNLDIECSGFFANRLSLVREFAPTAPVLFLIRSPEDWIGSVVNYFAKIGEQVSYNYIDHMFFEPICGASVAKFYSFPLIKQSSMVSRLLQYWINVYSKALNDPRALVIPLENIDEHLMEIEDFFEQKVKTDRSKIWRRENKDKKQFYLSDYIDLNLYKEDISILGY